MDKREQLEEARGRIEGLAVVRKHIFMRAEIKSVCPPTQRHQEAHACDASSHGAHARDL